MNSKKGKVLVGMSGGVDSSVAALLLLETGYEVVGCSLQLVSCDRLPQRSCCQARDREEARRICERLGIPHSTVDRRAAFREAVIDPFAQEYARGRTPSPCILCNERVKFRALLEEAARLGCDAIATGHYARIDQHGGRFRLRRGVDLQKDQSYFLYRLLQEELARTLFPVGGMTKGEVRRTAGDRGLPVKSKPESQEVCFVPDGDYPSFLEARSGGALGGPGNFVDPEGRVIGRHRGIHAYTIGQRRRLGFGIGRRQYVVRIDPRRNEVMLGGEEHLARREMAVRDVAWVGGEPRPCRGAVVCIRSTHRGATATVEAIGSDAAAVKFEEPVRAVAPGQAAVFYVGDEVIGGGWIESSETGETRETGSD